MNASRKTFITRLLPAILWLTITIAGAQAPDTLWSRTFGGSGGEFGRAAIQTTDGGYLLAGQTGSVSGDPNSGDVWLVRLNPNGDSLWSRIYGGNGRDEGITCFQLADGGFIISCATTSFNNGLLDAWLIRTDANGNTLWTKTYGGASEERPLDLKVTSDGGFIISGYTYSYGQGGPDVWLVRTDANGDTLWTKTYGGPSTDQGYAVIETSDGGFATIGRLSSFHAIGQADLWLIRTDANGDSLWSRSFAGPGFDWSFDIGSDLLQTSDGGFILAGRTDYGTIGQDIWLIRTDSGGDSLWTSTLNSGILDEGRSILQTADGGFVVAGFALPAQQSNTTDGMFYGISATGDSLWARSFSGSGSGQFFDISPTADNGFVVAGFTTSTSGGDSDAWIVRLEGSSTAIGNPAPGSLPAAFLLAQNYPNPFNPATHIRYQLTKASHIELAVFDVTGRKVATLARGPRSAGDYQSIWEATNMVSGVYIYRLTTEHGTTSRRMLLLK